MRVTCPACEAAYDVPDAVLAAGTRRLRCARCGQEWSPGVAAETAPLVAKAGPDTAAMPAAPLPRLVASPPMVPERLAASRSRTSPGVVAAAWGASIVVLVGLAAGGYVFRAAVQSAWPPSQLVYAALGLG